MSTTRHSSTTSMELTAPVVSPGSGSCLLAVVTCAAGASVGSVSDGLVEALSTAGCRLPEVSVLSDSVVVSMAVGDTGSAVAAAPAARLSVAFTCGASAGSASVVSDARRSISGAAPVFSIPPVPGAASQTTAQLARTMYRHHVAAAADRAVRQRRRSVPRWQGICPSLTFALVAHSPHPENPHR